MITTLNDFQVGFNVHDGEVASAAVLSRPTNRLKTEILEVNTLLGVVLNDPSKIPDWIAGTYDIDNIVKYLGKTWKAIAITSATPGSNPLLWSDISSIATSFAGISSGTFTGTPEIHEYANLAGFPGTGTSSNLYIAIDTKLLYRWTGTTYEVVAGTGTGSVDVFEYANLAGFPGTGTVSVVYIAQDTNKMYRWSGTAYIELAPGSGSVATATNLSGGVLNTIPYQSAANVTGFIAAPTVTNSFLNFDGTSFVWSTAAGSAVTVVNDIATDATFYPTFTNATSGAISTATVSNTNLTFNPGTGNFSSTTFTSLSDVNLKENIVTAPSSILNSLRGVEFTWKNTGTKSSGVIAQELETILPFLVQETNGVKSVNYSGLSAYFIETIKELTKRIEILEAK